MTIRWPLHPRPYPTEALSSWLKRIAALYNMYPDDLLEHDLGFSGMTNQQLDNDPPDALFERLENRTGVSVGRLRHMTLKGLLPASLSGTSGDTLFEAYAEQLSILLPADAPEPKSVGASWRPWFSKGRYERPWICPKCADEQEHRHNKLTWLLPLTATCPRHEVFLISSEWHGVIDLRPNKPRPRKPPPSLLALDRMTEEAITTGQMQLPHVCMPLQVWMQVLRVVINELNTPMASAGDAVGLLKAAWKSTGTIARAGARPHAAFEDVAPEKQVQFIEAAAFVVDQLGKQWNCGFGKDVGLLGGTSDFDVSKDVRSSAYLEQMQLAFEQMWTEARSSEVAARKLRNFLLADGATAGKLAEIDRLLTENGISQF